MQSEHETARVDAIIPVYAERPAALAATLLACAQQSYPISKIFVMDDGSPEVISVPEWPHRSPELILVRLPENQGISAARNTGIARSDAPLLACINTEVLPDPDWLAVCSDYLSAHPDVGAVFTRVVPHRPDRILTKWRMRFLEQKFGPQSRPVVFATGHAVLFRRQAIDAVGGYDVRYRLHHEDSDICKRMRTLGWETHYIAQSRCVSIQEDSLRQLAAKELRDSGWYSPESSLSHLYWDLSKWTVVRAGRNVVKGRWHFLPLDAAIWAYALVVATIRTLRFERRQATSSR